MLMQVSCKDMHACKHSPVNVQIKTHKRVNVSILLRYNRSDDLEFVRALYDTIISHMTSLVSSQQRPHTLSSQHYS